jgi:hypothetical protein
MTAASSCDANRVVGQPRGSQQRGNSRRCRQTLNSVVMGVLPKPATTWAATTEG